MPRGIGRPSNKPRKESLKTIRQVEKTYGDMDREAYGKAVTREARRQLVDIGAKDLAFRMQQADFQRETLVPSVRNQPSAFEVNAREARNAARHTQYLIKKMEQEKRRRAEPTNNVSPIGSPRKKK